MKESMQAFYNHSEVDNFGLSPCSRRKSCHLVKSMNFKIVVIIIIKGKKFVSKIKH